MKKSDLKQAVSTAIRNAKDNNAPIYLYNTILGLTLSFSKPAFNHHYIEMTKDTESTKETIDRFYKELNQ